ncbi:MAG TPA: DUF192 domain-containing protein [Syntrophales bacterium]|mgnify:CR=1 FL=1|jgi:hypothetical protein|nr:DUF192 domain-containing protein [Syntrophales bacterium]HRT61423.1 DUF192 domain-containing protein [Syntrophales bacterium]
MRRLSACLIALFCFSSFFTRAAFCQVKPSDQRTHSAGTPAGESGLATITVGSSTLRVEIALTPEAQSLGLMFRDSLPWDRGMLFVYDRPQHLAFWMKNTTIPLDIAFISADGRIEEILAMTPLTEKIYRSGVPALYALEVNRGWFRKKGSRSGTASGSDGLRQSPAPKSAGNPRNPRDPDHHEPTCRTR